VAPDRSSSVYVPAAVWDATATPQSGDWLVFRLDPSAPSATPGTGLAPASQTIDVTARWALDGAPLHGFLKPLDVAVVNSASGPLGQVVLYVDGTPYANFDPAEVETSLGPFDASDTRRFSLVQLDAAGNASSQTAALAALPDLAGMSADAATAALAARGFAL